jgi:hypothetical protein
MSKRLVGSVVALLTSAGLALAQAPAAPSAAIAPVDGSCAAPCCPCQPCDSACDSSRIWLSAEYLLWWFKDSPLPVPLVTTSTNLNVAVPGAIGQSGTVVLIGNRGIETDERNGARFTAGMWLDCDHTMGVEGNYFFIASKTVSQGVVSNGTTLLAVPFFNADNMMESAFVRAMPGVTSGSALLTLTSRLQGAELNGVLNLGNRGRTRLELLGGFRWIDFEEHLNFATTSLGIQTALPPTGNNGLVFDTLDRIRTRNDFYGGQLGLRGERQHGNWFVNGSVKVALGDMFEQANRRGTFTSNVFNSPAGGAVQSFSGFGAFVQPSNSGGAHRHEFAVVPEVGVNVGYSVRNGLRVFMGYDFLYISDVLRPGKQIDRTINFSQTVDSIAQGNGFTPGNRPGPGLTSSDFWAQGINFGVELRY